MRKIVLIGFFVSILIAVPTTYALTPTPSAADEEAMTMSPSPTKKASPSMLRTKTTTTASDEDVETFKDRRDAAKEKFMEDRTAFKEKMAAMKDTRKQAILERIDEQINNLNEKHTEKLDTHLTRLSEILEKIKVKAGDLKADGEETDALDTAIEKAEGSIEDARTALDTQIEKEYIIEFTTEAQIKAEATKISTAFKTDIRAVHTAVKTAHMDVVDAAKALAKVKKTTAIPTGMGKDSDKMTDDESTPGAQMEP